MQHDSSIDNALEVLSYAECFWYQEHPECKIVFDTRTGDVLDCPDDLIKESKRFAVVPIRSVKEITITDDLFLVTVIQTNGMENVIHVRYCTMNNTFRIRIYDPLAIIHEIINDVEAALYLSQWAHPVQLKHIKTLVPFEELVLDEITVVNQPPDIFNPDSETDDDTGFAFIEGEDDIDEPRPAPVYPRLTYEDDEGMPRLNSQWLSPRLSPRLSTHRLNMSHWMLRPIEPPVVVELPDAADIPKLESRADNIMVG